MRTRDIIILKISIATATFIWIIGATTTAWFTPSDNQTIDTLVRITTSLIGIMIGAKCWFSPIFTEEEKDVNN